MRRTYKTVKNAAKHTNQLTAQELINGRMDHNKYGWIDFTVKDFDQQIECIALLLGGRKIKDLLYTLRNRTPQHWGLKRVLYSKCGWSYCAGQDYPWELNQIRKYLYNI